MDTVFRFMFFDALKPFIYGDLRAFYVFCPVFTDFRGRKLKERLDFAKRQGGEPQAVRAVRQGEANVVFWQRKPLWLDFAKDKAVKPLTVRLVRQGEANVVFWRRKPLWLNFAKDKAVKPLTVRVVRQGKANAATQQFGKRRCYQPSELPVNKGFLGSPCFFHSPGQSGRVVF